MSEFRLQGKRIIVTRPQDRSQALCFLLEDEGAEVISLPMLELVPPADERPLQAAAEQLHRFQWILFASPSAVAAFLEAVRRAGTFAHLARVKLGAAGPSTARALEDEKLLVEAQGVGGDGLFQALAGKLKVGDQVLLPTAEEGRKELQELLESAQAEVTQVVAYRSEAAAHSTSELEEVLGAGVDAIIFGSPRSAHAFLSAGEESARRLLAQTPLLAIGQTTAQALRELGGSRVEVAPSPTDEGLLEAAVRALAS